MYTPCHFLLFLVFIYGLRVCNKHLYITLERFFDDVNDMLPLQQMFLPLVQLCKNVNACTVSNSTAKMIY